MRIGLFGGSFNPVHKGHIRLAKSALQILNLDKVLFVPAYCPPHKNQDILIDLSQRLEMLEIVTKDEVRFEISTVETSKKEVCYSVDTVKELLDTNPDWEKVYLLVGSDAALSINSWKEADKLLQLVQVVVFMRPGVTINDKDDRLIYVSNEQVDASSSEIREGQEGDVHVENMLDERIAHYLKQNNICR